MSRRAIVYAALVVTSVVISACSQPMAPRSNTITCPDGSIIVVNNGSGITCP